MSELKVSVSGIRGIWGKSLNLNTLLDYTKAFGRLIQKNNGKRILMGRDARPTGKIIATYCASILNSMGFSVLDIGLVPTPTVLFGVRQLGYDAGIIITASHNPVEWNALKFVKSGGVFTEESDLEEILKFYAEEKEMGENGERRLSDPSLCRYDEVGAISYDDKMSDRHIEAVLSKINRDSVKERNFKVVIDPVNSAGSLISQWLLLKLGCKIKVVNGEITGNFERGSEPIPENLRHLEHEIVDFGADVGFALDPDADRLVVIDEKGVVLSEEMTLALALNAVLSKKKGDVVINMSTSMLNEALAEKYGVRCYRSKVGEANVVGEIQKRNALIGGEGNGGVIYPEINIARDSLVGMGLILEYMAESGKTVSQIVSEFPKFVMKKEKYEFSGDVKQVLTKAVSLFPDAMVNQLDGVRLDFGKDCWLHIRASNTEPVVRVIGEGRDETQLNERMKRLSSILVNQ